MRRLRRVTYAVPHQSWNGALAAGASATFGFLATGTPGATGLSCTAS